MSSKIKPKAKGGKSSFGCITILLCVCCMVMLGLVLTVILVPSATDSSQGVSTNSLFVNTVMMRSKKLSERIREWTSHLREETVSTEVDDDGEAPQVPPPWEQEFWTPIDIMSVDSDPVVILCKLNFKQYSASPHNSPMFKDLVGNSNCMGSNRRREFMKKLLQEIASDPNAPENRVVQPNGFVFHESRVGSTLVANFMQSDPYAMVFSESNPMASAILHCESCTHEYNVQLFRDVTTLMGRSPFHTHLFFKFQSITVTGMTIALEVGG